jgi:protein SCO1/2
MRRLQTDLAGTDVRLVSFSVDPLYDTPQVLEEYARNVGADPARWLFLTGPLDEIRRVSFESFRLPFERDEAQPPGQLVAHRTVLTVVDREGQIRGYYDGETDSGVEQARARARFLANGP